MRSLVILINSILWSSLIFAHDINISTTTKNGSTIFYLQAGTYHLEKDAKQRQKELAARTDEPIEIKNLADRKMFLVQIGPIGNYPKAQELKLSLSKLKIPALEKNDAPPSKPESIANQLSNAQESQIKEPQLKESQVKESKANDKIWNLRNADIRAVIAEVSRVTGKNFVIDPRVQGKISVISSKPISNDALYEVFLSVLQLSGYAAIPSGAVIKIVPNIDAKTISTDPSEQVRPPIGDDMMVAVVPVEYVSADQLVPVLRPLMPQWSSITGYAPSNMLILSGRANNIKTLEKIIRQVDSSSASGIDTVHLHYALAMDIANTLKEIVKAQPVPGAKSQITIAADDRSNSILVSGSKTDRIRLRMLILKLDRGSNQGIHGNTQVVYLKYLRAEDLVPILAGIAKANFTGPVGTTIGTITRPALDSTNPSSSLASNSSTSGFSTTSSTSSSTSSSPTPSTGGGMSPGSSPATANTSTATTQIEGTTKPSVQIIAEPNTNSIILNAPPSIIRILKSVIAKLDIRPAQILIEAMIADVDEDDVKSLGVEWGTNSQTGNPANFSPGFAILNTKTSIDDFQAEIYALVTKKRANILSTPSVVVLDNRQAKILVGKQVSVSSTSYPNNAGGTTTASPFTTFDRVNVALHLYVRPQITSGKGIQMQIDQGNDTLDPSSVGNTTNPTFQISSIVTSVHVESGDVIVLGGLNQDSLANNDNELPALGGIPGIGRFFQHNIKSRAKRVLMVFIKPKILFNERDAIRISGEKYDDVRELEKEWVRSQDRFLQSDTETIMPPLSEAELPLPFSGGPAMIIAGKPKMAQVTK